MIFRVFADGGTVEINPRLFVDSREQEAEMAALRRGGDSESHAVPTVSEKVANGFILTPKGGLSAACARVLKLAASEVLSGKFPQAAKSSSLNCAIRLAHWRSLIYARIFKSANSAFATPSGPAAEAMNAMIRARKKG